MSVQTVGRYEIISELGRGAMGVVYKAQDPTIGRTVALKTMRLDVHGLETADVLRRFKNEARAAGVLIHPNIVTIFDAGEQDGMFYIAMEFIEGTTLQMLLAEKRVLAPEETIRITRQIAKGLDYAHSSGIVHRDIKPANIMITADGTVKIMDFGIAKSGSGMTSTGQILGTPSYMSPEQVKGRSLDGRSDLFSLGVILYEMVTGEKPFVGQSVTTIVYKIAHENPIPPRDLDGTVHPGLSMVVSKALAKSPDERYQTGAELIRDLENYKSSGSDLSDTGVLSVTAVNLVKLGDIAPPAPQAAAAAAAPATAVAPITEPQPAAPEVRRKRGVLPLLMTGVLLLTAALAGYFFYLYRTTKRMQEAERSQQQKTAEEQRQVAATAAVPKVTESKSQETAPASTLPSPQRLDTASDTAAKFQGELRFDSQPRGASVKIDNWTEPTWITPFKAAHLEAGKHTVVFSKAGYIQEQRTLTVTAGKNVPLSIQLSPAGSRLEVSSTPSGANIEVDGKDTGQVTPAEVIVAKGEHTVLVRKLGFSDFLITRTFEEGQPVNLSPILIQPVIEMKQPPSGLRKMFGSKDAIPPGKGLVQIHTAPEGATIQVGNRVVRRKTNALWQVEPGTYELVLTLDGYKPVRLTVRVQRGKAISLDETLKKQP